MLYVTLYESDGSEPLPTGWVTERSVLDVPETTTKLFSAILDSLGYSVVFTDDPTEGVDYLEL